MIRFLTFCTVIIVFSCKPTETSKPCDFEFDQKAMLDNYGSIIVPAFTDFQQKLEVLNTKALAFNSSPSLSTLTEFRTAYETVYLAWQYVAYFDFGPSETHDLQEKMNQFPANALQIDNQIANGVINLNDADSEFARGLPALDYLLYSGTDNEIIENFTTSTDNELRKQYVVKVLEEIISTTDLVVTEWNDSYLDFFTSTTGNASGMPVSLLLNTFNRYYEQVKRDKIGTPVGITTFGVANPTKVEASYSKLALPLLSASLKAGKEIFLGADGIGLDDYGKATKKERDGKSLNRLIDDQFDVALSKVETIPGLLSDAVISSSGLVNEAYVEVQRNVIYLKTDLPSSVCISITYVDDNPSDND